MQSAVDSFEKANSVPQILKDRLGRYQFMPVRRGVNDCCGFVYRILKSRRAVMPGEMPEVRSKGRDVRQ